MLFNASMNFNNSSPVDMIFGYPTGMGALLVRKDAAKLLKKKYFGGGTVAMSIAGADVVSKRDRMEQWLEDGTTSFLGIAALRHGFAWIDRLQTTNISRWESF